MPPTWCEVAFARDATDGSPLWQDVTDDVEWQDGVRISRRRSHELDDVTPGTLSLILLNSDGRYSAGNISSPNYPNVKINRPIRIRARWPISANMLSISNSTGQIADPDTGAALWSPPQGALSTSITVVPAGQTSALAWNTAGALGSTGLQLILGSSSVSTATSQGIPVTESLPYTLRCQVRRDASVALSMNARIRWYSSSGTFMSESAGTAVALSTTFQAVTCTATAPVGVAWARVLLVNTTTTASAVIVYAGAWQLEQAGAASAWVSPGVEYVRFVGFVDRWPHVWDKGVLGRVSLTATDQQKLLTRQVLGPDAPSVLIFGQLSGARITSMLTYAGVTVMTVDPGLSTLGFSGSELSQSLLAIIKVAATSEAGLFFIGRNGIPVFLDRGRRQRPSTTVLTVTADQCGEDLSFVIDDVLLINDATVLLNDGTPGSQQLDPASITEYGTYSKRLPTVLISLAEVNDRASYLLGTYAEPKPRAGQISIEAHSQPALWDELLGSEIGQRIQITSLPTSAPTGTLDLWVEGIQDIITDQSWTFTLDPSPASATISFILDDPVYGQLDNNRLGW